MELPKPSKEIQWLIDFVIAGNKVRWASEWHDYDEYELWQVFVGGYGEKGEPGSDYIFLSLPYSYEDLTKNPNSIKYRVGVALSNPALYDIKGADLKPGTPAWDRYHWASEFNYKIFNFFDFGKYFDLIPKDIPTKTHTPNH